MSKKQQKKPKKHHKREEYDEDDDLNDDEPGGALSMINTFDRPPRAKAEAGYAKQGLYVTGNRIPRAGYVAKTGYGRARVEASIFEAEAKGPNAAFVAEASLLGLKAMTRAEVASVSAKAGSAGVKFGLGFDTGVSVGADGVEIKILGTGVSVGTKNSVSVLGSEVSI